MTLRAPTLQGISFLALLGTLSLGACRESQTEMPSSSPAPAASSVASARLKVNRAEEAAKNDLAFTIDLYRQAAKEQGNIAFSPLALRMALAMVHEGARGQTQRELAAVLRLPERDPLGAMGALQRHWVDLGNSTVNAEAALKRSRDPDPTVMRANASAAAWVRKGRDLHIPFSQRLETELNARVASLDFATPDIAAAQINAWADEATHHRIPRFIEPENLGSPELLLTSAVWMHARWKNPFAYQETKPFHLTSSKSVNVPTLIDGIKTGYVETADVQVLSLPYWDDLASMLIVLPKGHDLRKVEASLSDKRVRAWQAALKVEPVRVRMPVFEASVTSPVGAWLEALGAKTMFGDGADLSGMSSAPIHVSAVRHTANILTDQGGTKLAAAAEVAVAVSHSGTTDESPVFQADRPFLYMVVDGRFGSVLFMGRVADPRL